MTLDNYISEAISTGKHKRRYDILGTDNTAEQWIEVLTAEGFHAITYTPEFYECPPKNEIWVVVKKGGGTATDSIRFEIGGGFYWISFDTSKSGHGGVEDVYVMSRWGNWEPANQKVAIEKICLLLERRNVSESISTGKHRQAYDQQDAEFTSSGTMSMGELATVLDDVSGGRDVTEISYTNIKMTNNVPRLINPYDRLKDYEKYKFVWFRALGYAFSRYDVIGVIDMHPDKSHKSKHGKTVATFYWILYTNDKKRNSAHAQLLRHGRVKRDRQHIVRTIWKGIRTQL